MENIQIILIALLVALAIYTICQGSNEGFAVTKSSKTAAKTPAKTAAKTTSKTAAKVPAKTAAKTAAKTPAKTAAKTATPVKTTIGVATKQPVVAAHADCMLSEWVEGQCSKTCGTGEQINVRHIISPAVNGGSACGAETDIVPCNTQQCAINCDMSPWQYGTCSKTCGGGTQTNTRKILTPSQGSGYTCGPTTETVKCNTDPCPGSCPGQQINPQTAILGDIDLSVAPQNVPSGPQPRRAYLAGNTIGTPRTLLTSNAQNIISPHDWNFDKQCGNENGNCVIPSGTLPAGTQTASVMYGGLLNGNPQYEIANFAPDANGNISCSNGNFGRDPTPGVGKSCFYSSIFPGGFSPVDYNFQQCAVEGGACHFLDSNPKNIIFGATVNGQPQYEMINTTPDANGNISCSNGNFGRDPAPGTVKACFA
jgi:hypothetical protein